MYGRSTVSIVASRQSKQYAKQRKRGSTNAMPNRLVLTGTGPPRMHAFDSNAFTHNIKTERVLVPHHGEFDG